MRYKFTFEFDTERELIRNEERQLCFNLHANAVRELKHIPLPFINNNLKSNVEKITEIYPMEP
jgi:hypothetical protein